MNWKVTGQFPPAGSEPAESLQPLAILLLASLEEGSKLPTRVDGKPADWVTMEAEGTSGLMNLDLLPGGPWEGSLAVAVTQVWAEEARQVSFSFGADYWAVVFLNGETLIDRTRRDGPPGPGEVRQPATLKKGWNTIVVGVVAGSGGSAFWLATLGGPTLPSRASLTVPLVSPADLAADPAAAAIKSVATSDREDAFWIKPGSGMLAFAKIDAAKPLGPVNRRLLGACLMHPPESKKPENQQLDYGTFGDGFIEAVRPFLVEGGVRVWMHPPNTHWTAWWQDTLERLGTKTKYAFVNVGARENKKVFYFNEEDNNLQPYQKPEAWASYVERVNSGRDGTPRFTHWELWNEPSFDLNGGWDPVEHARWCVDTARRMKAVDPGILIGPHIYGGGPWNETMLAELSRAEPDLFGFIVNHYYDVTWFQQWDTFGSYLGRVAYPELIRQHVRRDLALLEKYGKGRWPLVITEWNSHPQRYDWPGKISRDMATALFQASTVQVFAEEGVDAAQVFLLHGDSFALIGDKDAKVKYPPFHVFDLYGRHYKGERLATQTVGPSFAWRQDSSASRSEPLDIPYVDLLAAKHEGRIVLMAVNKHPESEITLDVEIVGLDSQPAKALLSSVVSDDKESDVARIEDSEVRLQGGKIRIPLPKHSFSAIRLE